MPEQLQNIINRIRDWWSKYDARQKAMMISAVAVVAIAFGILAFVVSRPTWVTLTTVTTASDAETVKNLLEENTITYTMEEVGSSYVFKVKSEDETNAGLLIGTNNIPSSRYSLSDVLDGSFTSTEADKQKKYLQYLQEEFADYLESMDTVNTAKVTLNIPDDDGTLIANDEDSYCSVIIDGTMDTEQAASVAQYLATNLGNDNTENITILDSKSNVLFSGGDEATTAGIASSNQKVKQEAETLMVTKVKNILSESENGSAIFDNTQIAVNLAMNFDDTNTVQYDYSADDDRTEGYLSSETYSTSENTTGTAGTPGTDSNDDTTYVTEDSDTSSSSTEDYSRNYLPDETITTTNGEKGKVDYTTSTLSIVAYRYVTYSEELMTAEDLGDLTFEQYAAENSDIVKTEVDEDIITAVSNATSIPTENITVLTYDVPMFEYKTAAIDIADILEIVMAVLIFAMLGFVVFRTLRREEEEEVAEEVSVETLLEQHQEEENLEDIGFNEKSEARILIEKFVDEKPEAVANLLRNWLNEDWG
ncbi:MAG: flagellar biosynthesis protein [Lachnospiraceae bacterium]|nr:flagellar biosynthesis protein [Lachnospiraceae bacterium]